MVELLEDRFSIDGKPFFLYSGEIHYFRLTPAQWPRHLRAAREAGLNTVSSYVPWLWHEPEPGRFDFDGATHPQRDLERWLRLVDEHGLRFLARVGPVSNAELVNEGVPGWLLERHPEVFVRGREITNLPHTTLLAYLNPTFQERVGQWYERVLPVVGRHAHPQGPVVMVQLDNEIGMVHWLQKAADYSPQTEEMFRRFVRERHGGDLARLNAAWRTSHASFDEVAQPPSGDDAQPMMRLWDWMAFYQRYYARYFGSLHERYRVAGLSLPVLANIPQFYDYDVRGRGVFAPMTSMMFRDFPAEVPATVFGGAYQMRRLDYENFHDVALTTEVVRMITRPGVPSVCAELQTGIMRDRPRLYPADVELNLKLSTAHGLAGVNGYMFSGGVNEPGMGAFGSYHEWQAAVRPDGSRRAHFRAMKDFGRQVRSFGPALAETAKRHDLAVGFYAPYWTTEYLTGPRIEDWEWRKHHLFYDGLSRLLQLAQIQHRLVDLERASDEDLRRLPALVVFALEFMDAATQAKLVRYVAGGGRLMLNPALPVRGLDLEPCTVLADALGVEVLGTRHRDLGFRIGRRDHLAIGELSALAAPGAAVLAAAPDGTPCAVRVERGGQAWIVALGLNHMFDYHVDLVRDWMAAMGVTPAVTAEGDLEPCLRAAEGHGFLFLANLHDIPQRGRVRLVLPGESRPVTLPARGRLAVDRRRCHILPLRLPLPGGARLRYSTAEVLEAGGTRARLRVVVTGMAGAEAELEFETRARRATLDGRRLAASAAGGRLRLRFPLSGAPQTLVVG